MGEDGAKMMAPSIQRRPKKLGEGTTYILGAEVCQ